MSAPPCVRIETARPEDDRELRALLADQPMPGAIRVSFLREPSFFDALSVEGAHRDVLVARDAVDGRAVGVGLRSVKPAYVNGSVSGLGYLGGLRLQPAYRGRAALARGYRLLRDLHGDRRAALYLTTIVERNAPARALLTSGRCGLPRYTDLGRFLCLALSTRQRRRAGAPDGVSVRPATAGDAPALAAFLQREGRARQFFPRYAEADLLAGDGLLRGLETRDVFMAVRDGEVLGTMAAWDQTPFRQSRIDGYAWWLGALRPAFNAWARLAGYPALPPPGSLLKALTLALVCVRGDDRTVFSALLAAVLAGRRRTHPVCLAGLHERDPFLPALRELKHVPYTSRLYAVAWEDGQPALEALEQQRVPYLELGAL